jgi:hypothetical protein
MMQNDNYVEDEARTVLFKWKRYRVIRSTKTSAYSLWYSGNIIAIDPSREKIVKRFKDAMENVREVAI